jgi:hypothetical protein
MFYLGNFFDRKRATYSGSKCASTLLLNEQRGISRNRGKASKWLVLKKL